ncbi:TetR/AcrR family transcriptional regulator [Massilia luteola]|uniref:TetR/AcrR family transcriptional regulator n=1 Tax=Massilia luteola TaxID=3081751 RepID=UPI002ACC24AE|nr:TetR family transcriptional regulator [Massilia sp. Gc5]
MTRPRGRPARGQGVTREAIVDAALALLGEEGGAGLTMRTLAARLGVTPMSLYHHVTDRAGLLRALSEQVYGDVLSGVGQSGDPVAGIRMLLTRYYDLVVAHPQLTLAIFAEPAAFAGASREITDRLTALLAAVTPGHIVWRDILVDHAHGGGLALIAARTDAARVEALRAGYRQALDCLLAQLTTA